MIPAACENRAFLMCRGFVPDVPKDSFLMCRDFVPDVPKPIFKPVDNCRIRGNPVNHGDNFLSPVDKRSRNAEARGNREGASGPPGAPPARVRSVPDVPKTGVGLTLRRGGAERRRLPEGPDVLRGRGAFPMCRRIPRLSTRRRPSGVPDVPKPGRRKGCPRGDGGERPPLRPCVRTGFIEASHDLEEKAGREDGVSPGSRHIGNARQASRRPLCLRAKP